MKKFFKFSLIIAAAAMTLAACNKGEIEQPVNEEGFYYTFTLGSPETKALLASDTNGKFGAWEEGDQLGSAVNDGAPGFSNIATTSSPVTFQIYKSGGLKENDVVYTYYPRNPQATSTSAIPFTIPVAQSQNGTSFDFDAMPMVGEGFVVPATLESTTNQTPVGDISLVNLGSVIDYQIYSSNATYAAETIISVKLTASKAIAGSFTKDITSVKNNDETTLTISGYSETAVTTSVSTPAAIGATRADASHVYMVIAPVDGVSEEGITGTVLVTTDKAKYTFYISSAQKFKRSGLKSFGLNLDNCANRVAEETVVPTTTSYKLDDYYQENVKVNPLQLDAVVSLTTTTTGNSGKFYGTAPNRDWRLYQSEDAFVTVSVPIGYELQSIQFTYNTSNGGTLEGAASGDVLSVSGRSQTYNVINTGSATNGQVRLTAISVSYVTVPVSEGYQLMSTVAEIETGQYVIAAKVNGKYYAMSNTFASKIDGAEITVTDGIIATSAANNYDVTITKTSSNYTIEGSENTLLGYSSSTNFDLDNTNTNWTVSAGVNGTFRIANANTTTRVIAYNGSQFGAYSSSNVTSGSTSYYDVELFKFNGTPKTKPTTTVTPASPINLEVGDTQQLTVTTNSDGVKSYESSATAVATVTNDGLIEAVAAGTATITVKTAATDTFSEGTTLVTVEVTDPNAPGLSVSPATTAASPASWPADNDDAKTFTITPTNGIWNFDASGVSSWVNVSRSENILTVTPKAKQATDANSGSITITLTPSSTGYSNITETIYLSQAKYNNNPTTVVDKLTNSNTINSTSTSYSNWTVAYTATSSGAAYAGNSAGGNSSIQLRSSNSNSGVVTTKSGGKVKKIVVTWNTNTQNGRTLNVYGKNSAYDAASDLYDNSKQGTLLGTIVCGTSTELTITDDYTYIGFRSASSAMYLGEVDITWEN